MPFNLLLLPLLAGYIFIHNDLYLKFKAQTLDGYRLLFEASKFGLLFAVVGRLIAWLIGLIPALQPLIRELRGLAPYDYIGTALSALLLSVLLGPLANLRHDPASAKAKALAELDSLLFQLLHEAAQQGHLVSVTLDTRKWYVGYIVRSPNLEPREQYFSIIPVFSGYRDKDTLEAKRLTEYRFDPDANPDLYAKILPAARIVDANLFDVDLFETYYEHQIPSAAELAP